ncbi:hypothetical protein [Flagellimonas algicola]|uniref:Uncharacterized protein n=1 Tax=Flagellimonas algicola TaxID=2583815 RepID=A0ABY2WG56_9FLAO|nr:hypothetical protein [Allomuricauda algicola]TMU50396.1 hypothetical protein FGG15_19810 [Allomuricauda algicola]
MRLIFTLSLLLLSTLAFSQNNWKLIYENNANGATIHGNLDALISAIQSGASVRIYFNSKRPDRPDTYEEHTSMVKFFTIVNSPQGRFVTAQIDPIAGQTTDFHRNKVLLKENLEWSLIASTTGENDTMVRDVITGEVLNHRQVRWGTKWYVITK